MSKANVLYFIGGALLGAAGMYFATRNYFNNLIDQEVEDVQLYYENKIRDLESSKDEEPVEVADTKHEAPKSKINRTANVDAEVEPDYDEIIDKLNYNKFSTNVPEKSEGPCIVDFDEYGNGNYDTVECIWFSEDEVLMNAVTEQVIDNPDKEVGLINMDKFGASDGGDEDELYIRNEKLGCEYHVCLEVSTTYADSEFAGSEGDE